MQPYEDASVGGDGKENEKKTLSSLGLCARARKLICGVPLICEALRANKPVYAVFAAGGIGANSEKRLRDRCAYYGVRLLFLRADAETLAHAVGKSGSVAAVGVTDANFARLLTPDGEK